MKTAMKQFEMRQKQTFLSQINEGYVSTRIIEIGFNGGNSAAAILSFRETISCLSILEAIHMSNVQRS
jgi:hypothetical protein